MNPKLGIVSNGVEHFAIIPKNNRALVYLSSSFESAASSHSLAGVKLKSHTYELQESNVKLKVVLYKQY